MKNFAICSLLYWIFIGTANAFDQTTCNDLSITECESKKEEHIILNSNDLIKRHKKQLILKNIKLVNPPKVLVDDDENQYRVVSFFPDYNITLVSVTGFEYSNAYIYDHKYGWWKEAFGQIAFSDNGKYLIAYNADIESGFSPNAIAIYRLGDWPELLTSFHNMNFGVVNAKFISSSKIQLETQFISESSENGFGKGKCNISYQSGIWQFSNLDCQKTQ